jgi:hypothetical protein
MKENILLFFKCNILAKVLRSESWSAMIRAGATWLNRTIVPDWHPAIGRQQSTWASPAPIEKIDVPDIAVINGRIRTASCTKWDKSISIDPAKSNLRAGGPAIRHFHSRGACRIEKTNQHENLCDRRPAGVRP